MILWPYLSQKMTLQHRHVSIKTSQFTGEASACSTTFNSKTSKIRITEPIVRKSFVDSTHKGTVLVKVFLCHDIVMEQTRSSVKFWWRKVLLWLYHATVKHVYNDHLMRYFSAFWISSRWPRATMMSSRRQKLLASVNWYLQPSLKHITE